MHFLRISQWIYSPLFLEISSRYIVKHLCFIADGMQRKHTLRLITDKRLFSHSVRFRGGMLNTRVKNTKLNVNNINIVMNQFSAKYLIKTKVGRC